jgi:hypothetical protein
LGATVRTHDVGGAGLAPNLEIGGGVSYILEAGSAEMFGEKIGLVVSLQVELTVAGMHLVEESEVARDGFGEFPVGGGDQRDATAFSALLLEKVDDFLAIGKACGVQARFRCQLALHEGSSRKQPEREKEQREGMSLKEGENTLPQEVAADQSAVQIDAQNWRWRLSELGSCDRSHETDGRIKGRVNYGGKWHTTVT